MRGLLQSLYGRAIGLVAMVVVSSVAVLVLEVFSVGKLQERHTMHQVSEAFLEADQHRTDFQRTRHPSTMTEAVNAVERADSLVSGLQSRHYRRLLKAHLSGYSSTLGDLGRVLDLRGLDENSGAEGRFRASAHTIEALVQEAGRDDILLAMLSARRSEKNFIMRAGEESVAQVAMAIDQIQALNQASVIIEDLQSQIQAEADAYRLHFMVLVDLLGQSDRLASRLNDYSSAFHAVADEAVVQVEAQADLFQRCALMAVILAGLLGISIAFATTHHVVSPLTRLRNAASQIGQGETDVSIDINRTDELGELAKAISQVSVYVKEREQAEAALQNAHRYTQTIVDSVQEGVVVFDESLRVQSWNQYVEEATGISAEQAYGRSFTDFYPKEEARMIGIMLRRALNGHTVRFEDRFFERKNADEAMWYAATLSPLRDSSGDIVGVVGNFHDVTHRKEMEQHLISAKEQAEEMARMKSAFLANMSHEIRTPLSGIIGFAQVIHDELPDDQREFAGLIENNGKRLLQTLNSILDLAQLESGSMTMHIRENSVTEEALAAVRLFRPLASLKNIALEVDFPEQEVSASFDQTGLARILNNLVSNAIKFTESGGVNVTIVEQASCVRIDVSDTGRGIDPQFLPHLFEEFSQESQGTSRSHEGSGLGLALSKRMADMMNCTLEVTSTKGEGSTFRISIPKKSESGRKPHRRPLKSALPSMERIS